MQHHALPAICLANEGMEVRLAEDDVCRASELLLKLVADRTALEPERGGRLDDEVDIGRFVRIASRLTSEQRDLLEAMFHCDASHRLLNIRDLKHAAPPCRVKPTDDYVRRFSPDLRQSCCMAKRREG